MRYDASGWNYDESQPLEASWRDLRDELTIGRPRCCFIDIPHLVSEEVKDMLDRMRNWGELYSMGDDTYPDGIYPIAWTNRRLWFTDIEENASLDCHWASDHLFSVPCEQPNIDAYMPQLSEDCKLFKMPAYSHLTSDQLLNIIDNSIGNVIQHFIQDAGDHHLKFKYTDKHLKSQLGMNITIQFIRQIVLQYNLKDYEIEFLGNEYDLQDGFFANDNDRLLMSNMYDENERDAILANMLNVFGDNNRVVRSVHNFPQHWRDLVIEDIETHHKLSVLPNGGFQNGWFFDVANCHGVPYRCNNTDATTNIPIYNKTMLKFHIEIEN